MRAFLFLVAFGAAIWAIGEGWAALVETWAGPTWMEVAAVVGYLAVFLAAFLYLGLGVYATDRAAGKVRRRIGLYERILSRRVREEGARSGERNATAHGKG